jgi:hypothetical protein
MLNKFGRKVFAVLYFLYALAILIYELFVINVLSRDFGICVVGFTVLNLVIDAITLVICPIVCKIDYKKSSSLSVFALLLTVMMFATVVYARNILKDFKFAVALLIILAIYLLFSIPIWFSFLKDFKDRK